jgi:chitinase
MFGLAASLLAAAALTGCGGGADSGEAQAAQADGRSHALAADVTAEAASSTVVAPYFATWAFGQGGYNVKSLMDARSKAGLHAATLAFIVAGNGCSFDDGGHTIDVDMKSDIAAFRAAGGKVIVSFGGASGTYLEARCSASQMASLIDGLIQRHGFRDLDFDVEGSQLGKSSLNTVRNAAIKTLQAKYHDLNISFTLPVMPEGLDKLGIGLVKGAVAAGVKVKVVNVMAMDYGYNGDMGRFAIQAAQATAQQLTGVYPGKSATQLLSMVGITPMIGHNDDAGVFTLSHAKAVATFAKGNGIPLLAYWDFQRDAPGASGDNGSGSNSSNFQYFKAFAAAEGSTPTPPSGCTYVTWQDNHNYPKGTIVKYPPNGKFYKEVNAGTHGSDGTDPTISTWYWQPTSCN